MANQVVWKKINRVPKEDQMYVRKMRNQKSIRKWMYSTDKISTETHKRWLQNTTTKENKIVFVIYKKSDPVGVVSVDDIDKENKRSSWAFYIKEGHRGGGLGSLIEYNLINFVFEELELRKLNCEVIQGNDPVVKLHKKFFFEEEGFKKSEISRGEKRKGVHVLGLTKERWKKNKKEIKKSIERIRKNFTIKIEHE